METFMKVYVSLSLRIRRNTGMVWMRSLGVLEKMRPAIFNKDSRAFRATCKKLGIKHTYSAIAHYITNHATLHLPSYNVPLGVSPGCHESGARGRSSSEVGGRETV